ncbi:20129_t:CDS:2 [Gigaspora margarita]|uniref:20129_t:CDS:1 n=1 Tax=Gigaspora margarita TaxID=4874 RepID=A0ABN7VMP9_GIGMA|nr:20129_t:CDS:2 [Gigaspora margarita]
MFEIQNSYQVFDECDMNNDTTYYHEDDMEEYDMNNETTYYPEDDMEIALPPNKCYFDTLPVIGYVDKTGISYEGSEYEHGQDTLSVVENVVDSDSSKLESEDVEDGISECNNLEDEPNDSFLKDIYTEQTFTSFEVLEKCLKRYLMKKAGNCLIKCGFVLNASYRKCLNLVFVNKFVDEHNHALNDCKLLQLSPSLRKIPTHIRDKIRFYVQEYHLEITVLKRILQNKFSDQEIYDKDLYNMISRFKADVQIKNDALTLYKSLVKLQQKNLDWYFKVDFKDIDNRLSKIFWILPDQKSLWARFHDQSRIVATAIVCDKTISTYEWILEQTKLATGNLQLVIIFTDADLAMQVQEYCDRVLYSTKECWAYAFMKHKFLSNTHSTQRAERIELRLKDKAKYARLKEFCNMNPTTGLPNVSNTIFKGIDGMCKKFLTTNSLALQRRQMFESLLYRTFLCTNESDIIINQAKDDYEEPQILLKMALEDCYGFNVTEIWEVKHIQSTTNHSQFVLLLDDGTHYCTCLYLLISSRWYSEEGLEIFDKNQEPSVQLVQNEGEQFPTNSKKVAYSHGLGFCKKALNKALTNGSNQVLENILQRFIDEQAELNQENDSFNISNPSQHKGKGRPANKRYLIAIEDYNNKNISSSIQNAILELEPIKKNKHQCAICKSWYHDSRNCPEKVAS